MEARITKILNYEGSIWLDTERGRFLVSPFYMRLFNPSTGGWYTYRNGEQGYIPPRDSPSVPR